ncbi:SMC-Scp complex subunit ScpB [Marinicella gelatinilytica]|uniref:SMC-Scp complex subunit ScpB n=1 Tax=Marinicella gelatinilytica TaxID=2996017 RepID=UPI002260BCB4|nr:SMC-Scp complex subunit ScpB [Marinicella gelatinilytica]MCX7544552.1 SMC-Scp complex subunit ScpB [Marinicella gelatinilytica]
MDNAQIKNIVEAALMSFDEPLSVHHLKQLFDEEAVSGADINLALQSLHEDYANRGIELQQLSKGFRLQTRPQMQVWLDNLRQKKPRKLSRALLETLALVAYRQPLTRGEIEDVRGVAVSSKIIHYLMDKEWIEEVGYRDAPGKPALLGTTDAFLNYFNLKSLQDLPALADIKDFESFEQSLDFNEQSAT